MSSGSRRPTRNAIRDSDLPKSRGNSSNQSSGGRSAGTSSRSNRRQEPTESTTVKTTTTTLSSLEEAQLLIGAAGSMTGDEGQVLYFYSDDQSGQAHVVQQDVIQSEEPQNQEAPSNEQQQESTEGTEALETEPAKPEISEEDLKKELQALLDSQIPSASSDEDDASKHLMGKNPDEELIEDPDAHERPEPTKGFSKSEIQAFMNNQIKKQHQHHVQMEQDEQKKLHQDQVQVTTRNNHRGQQEQHVQILVTENGHKIILIQNPESEDNDPADFQPQIELSEEEEQLIQMQHKARQQMLLMHLEKLREVHKRKLPASVTTPAVPHLQPIKLVPIPKSGKRSTNDTNDTSATCVKTEPGQEEESEEASGSQSGVATSSSSRHRSKPKVLRVTKKPVGPYPRWFRPTVSYLNLAVRYMKRRQEKVEHVKKLFPTGSSSFERRCQDMKESLMNLELMIERFQNSIGQEIEDVSNKFKSFLRDFHLEDTMCEIEAEDDVDEFDSNLFDFESLHQADLSSSSADAKSKSRRNNRRSVVNTGSNMQLITPPTISITSASVADAVVVDDNHNDTAAADESSSTNDKSKDPFVFKDTEQLVAVKAILPSSLSSNSSTSVSPKLVNSKEPKSPSKGTVASSSASESPERSYRSARLQNKRKAVDEPPVKPPVRRRGGRY